MQFRKLVGEYCWPGNLLNWGDGKERSGELLTQAVFEERGEVRVAFRRPDNSYNSSSLCA